MTARRGPEDSGDAENRIAGGLCSAFGAVLTVWAWRSAMRGEYEITPAVLGPSVLSLGVGLLIHGGRMPILGVNTLIRAYGLAGAAFSVGLLYYFGYFQRPAPHRALWLMESALPFVLVVYWSLPARFLGGPPRDLFGPR